MFLCFIVLIENPIRKCYRKNGSKCWTLKINVTNGFDDTNIWRCDGWKYVVKSSETNSTPILFLPRPWTLHRDTPIPTSNIFSTFRCNLKFGAKNIVWIWTLYVTSYRGFIKLAVGVPFSIYQISTVSEATLQRGIKTLLMAVSDPDNVDVGPVSAEVGFKQCSVYWKCYCVKQLSNFACKWCYLVEILSIFVAQKHNNSSAKILLEEANYKRNAWRWSSKVPKKVGQLNALPKSSL